MNYKIFLIIATFFLFSSKKTFAQYQLTVTSKNTIDSIAYLRGVVFDDKNFIPKDTINLYKGINNIKYTKSIVGGIYFLYFPKTKQKIYLTLENNDVINLSVAGADYLSTINTNNIKNQKFFNYQKLAVSFSDVDSTYEMQVKQGKKFNLAQKATFFDAKNKQLMAARNEIMKTLKPDAALYIYFDALNKLDLSVPNKKKYDEREKFIHSININAPRFLFTPVVKQVLTEYLSYYPLQADSIVKGVDSIMLKMDCKGKAYPYVFDQLSKILNNRDIQNNTEGYSYFINKYVKDNKCKFLDPKSEKQLLDNLEKIKKISSQDTAINITLKDTAGIERNLHDFAKNYDFTLITFFDPTCEHCKVELPKMDSTIQLLEQQLVLKIGKFTVCNDMGTQPDIWKAFINDFNLSNNYMHVSLGANNEIRNAYDAYTNPLFYLIDKQGKFLSKKLSTNTLRKILSNYLQNIK
jgi:hypothetical protein